MDIVERNYIIGIVACVAIVALVGLIMTFTYSLSPSGAAQASGLSSQSASQNSIASGAATASPSMHDAYYDGTINAGAGSDASSTAPVRLVQKEQVMPARKCAAGATCSSPLQSTFTGASCEKVVTACQYGCNKNSGHCNVLT